MKAPGRLLLLPLLLAASVLPGANVHVVKYESQADLCVRRVCHESQARGADEFWHYVKYESQADVKVFFVKHESQADIKVHFVRYDSQAGWRAQSPFQGRLAAGGQ
jgi:hypothetical protein